MSASLYGVLWPADRLQDPDGELPRGSHAAEARNRHLVYHERPVPR